MSRLKLPPVAERNTRAAKYAAAYRHDRSGEQKAIARMGWRAGYRAALRDVRKARSAPATPASVGCSPNCHICRAQSGALGGTRVA